MAEVTCSLCGRTRDGEPPVRALAWVSEQDERGQTWLCPECARKHVRDIEGKLPADYW